jgi:long-subunit fatty acid transport protein
LGVEYRFEKLTVDYAYNYLVEVDRGLGHEVGDLGAAGERNGKFEDIHAHIFMITFSYKFTN